MGILTLDVSRYGVVMSADSQPVELLDGGNRVTHTRTQRSRNPIVVRRGGGFTGLVGFVGRERIAGKPTREWLEMFSAHHPTDSLSTYCVALAEELSRRWQHQQLRSGLWVFVSGVEGSDVRFWYVCNVGGVNPDGSYIKPRTTFAAVDDLDANYIKRDLAPGQTKSQLLRTRMYLFRNGVLKPSAMVFDAFNNTLQRIYAERIPGFPPVRSLDDLAFLDRQRMEFAKRLFSPQHGIAKAPSLGIAGTVHVMGVTLTGEIRAYHKLRGQVKTIP